MIRSFVLLFLCIVLVSFTLPNSTTPGHICTPEDPDFKGFYYKAHVAKCNRNVSKAEKLQVAKNYKITDSWTNYEFDHLIPLNSGGSNNIKNIWPQPIKEARLKNVVEQATFDGLSNGTLTQQQAIDMNINWFKSGIHE